MESFVLAPPPVLAVPGGPWEGSCMPMKGCAPSEGGAETTLAEEEFDAVCSLEEGERPVRRSIVGWGGGFLAGLEEEPLSSDIRLEPLVLAGEGVGCGEGECPVPAGRGTEIT